MIWKDAQTLRYVTDFKIPAGDWSDFILSSHIVFLYEEYLDHGVEHLCILLGKYESYASHFFKEVFTKKSFYIWDKKSHLYNTQVFIPEHDRVYLTTMEI